MSTLYSKTEVFRRTTEIIKIGAILRRKRRSLEKKNVVVIRGAIRSLTRHSMTDIRSFVSLGTWNIIRYKIYGSCTFYQLILRDPSATVAIINYIRCERTGGRKKNGVTGGASVCNQEIRAIWDPISGVHTPRSTHSGDRATSRSTRAE